MTITMGMIKPATHRESPSGVAPTLGRALVRVTGFISTLLAVGVVIGFGVKFRELGYLTPDRGIGYWFGVLGLVLMIILLGYPLRKRRPQAQKLGTVRGWFRLHMLLGIIGPLFVVLHANFGVGSPNSAFALGSMLIVASSGVVGRYLYKGIHRGLYGSRLTLEELSEDALVGMRRMEQALPLGYGTEEALRVLTDLALVAPTNFPGAIVNARRVRRRIKELRPTVRRQVRLASVSGTRWSIRGWSRRRALTRRSLRGTEEYFAALRRASMFSVFERLFKLWHFLHVPLFIVLLVAVAFHVVAVHAY